MLPEILKRGLWHTTSIERFNSILNAGFILPNPEIPDSERWCTKLGSHHYPYVRSLGGVSIFDFRDFDEHEYTEKYPLSSWRTFVPCRKEWDFTVWIELNYENIKEGFIDPTTLLDQWKKQGAYGHNIMPLIEAAHIGCISIDSFSQVLKYTCQTKEFLSCSLHNLTHFGQ